MPVIKIETKINAKIKDCFDLARNVDFYQDTLKNNLKYSKEIAISGKVAGLVCLNDYITWESNHFGFVQHLTLKISEFKTPYLFVEELVFGVFKTYRHEHHFVEKGNKTIMTNVFHFELPYGILGKLLSWMFFKKYMTKFIKTRNNLLKAKAEKQLVSLTNLQFR
ncbi:hypothetical protein BWZ22_00395 [Seonamhaeicola sp. S2-3]|uniref:SRPBCC family protein n=1 Tax=Seonamhaeicola sp. S2-3 TaxID=1936081 RepID=UPI000972D147|nr:SRPBCC family protein [Seonamhaeicola sp. S2-3]APY09797.1 hypothetical protein BWZ22_00395 [Seonamhaeicola sp. S2-3]